LYGPTWAKKKRNQELLGLYDEGLQIRPLINDRKEMSSSLQGGVPVTQRKERNGEWLRWRHRDPVVVVVGNGKHGQVWVGHFSI
jgi:hypothetical protein